MVKSSIVSIEAKNLSAVYGQRTIWRQASFKINQGEFVGILGANGAGKTTLFRLLLGLLTPQSGSLTILNQAPKRGNPRIGYVPQRRTVDSEMNIEAVEFVRLAVHGRQWGIARPKTSRNDLNEALEALKLVDALELAHRPLGSLSGGEQQRIFLAQALVSNPEILLLDEPLANLDIRREVQLVKVIDKIVKTKGVTALLIAHDLNPLLPSINRVLYFANGHVASGPAESVITSQSLSRLYGANVEVITSPSGRVAVLGVEKAAHPHV